MAIIAEEFEFSVGVDTAAFPATTAGMDRATTWIRRRTGGERLSATVEGTSSYVPDSPQPWLVANIEVGEVRPPTCSSRALTGKSDPD